MRPDLTPHQASPTREELSHADVTHTVGQGPASDAKRACERLTRTLLSWTTCDSPCRARSECCFAMAKEASAEPRSALLRFVQLGRLVGYAGAPAYLCRVRGQLFRCLWQEQSWTAW
jgi:hypothetical protein